MQQSGELVVSGKDKVHIPLDGYPRKVEAYFMDVCEIVPCDPHHVDMLECDVHASNTHKSGYVMVISWQVSGVREIKWVAVY